MVYTYTELRKIKIMPMDNCWMSPEGEVIYSNHHDCKAWDIIERRFGIHPSDVKEPSIFLGAKKMDSIPRSSLVDWMVDILLFPRSNSSSN